MSTNTDASIATRALLDNLLHEDELESLYNQMRDMEFPWIER